MQDTGIEFVRPGRGRRVHRALLPRSAGARPMSRLDAIIPASSQFKTIQEAYEELRRVKGF